MIDFIGSYGLMIGILILAIAMLFNRKKTTSSTKEIDPKIDKGMFYLEMGMWLFGVLFSLAGLFVLLIVESNSGVSGNEKFMTLPLILGCAYMMKRTWDKNKVKAKPVKKKQRPIS